MFKEEYFDEVALHGSMVWEEPVEYSFLKSGKLKLKRRLPVQVFHAVRVRAYMSLFAHMFNNVHNVECIKLIKLYKYLRNFSNVIYYVRNEIVLNGSRVLVHGKGMHTISEIKDMDFKDMDSYHVGDIFICETDGLVYVYVSKVIREVK